MTDCGYTDAEQALAAWKQRCLDAEDDITFEQGRLEVSFEEIARLREFGEHYSGAAQDAWDRIAVLEKALREIERKNSTLGSVGQFAAIARDALAAAVVSTEPAP